MDEKSVEFASLLASRLCHDLLSPIGALNNGVELLADEHDPEMRERCVELLGESARTSAAKLKFFRLAFGAAGGFEDEIDAREAQTAIEGLIGTKGRIDLEWMVGPSTMAKAKIKVLLNLALIAADAMVRGGKLLVGAEQDEIVVRAEGERLILDPELKNALLGKTGEDGLTPRAAAAWLAHVLVRQGGGEIQVSEPEENVLLFGAAFAS
ncbi:MAG: histidine phosphotransferase family protein [Parasphingopyxis sp.]|uniref:histidine phosphotransferase family protein n=1 Tax=Parasphingopyxis sp. TaxID=1920299 RepID=UPI002607BBBF|nr:histidine phosphotransferase family protein [uncultured Parasphingopyxis sp.]